MSASTTPPETPWEAKRTDETRAVENLLRLHFTSVVAYRYNNASIRARIVDAKFDGLNRSARIDLVEPYLDLLPVETQRDIVMLLACTPSSAWAPEDLFGERERIREFEENYESND